VITGEADSGEVVLNGAAARLVQPGDKVIIMSYAAYDQAELEGFQPSLVFVDDANRIVETGRRERTGRELRIEAQ
jgi:aspartate 1-decarboxylase